MNVEVGLQILSAVVDCCTTPDLAPIYEMTKLKAVCVENKMLGSHHPCSHW